MDRVSRDLEDAEVVDPSGRIHLLREAWSERACVLLFVRQFG